MRKILFGLCDNTIHLYAIHKGAIVLHDSAETPYLNDGIPTDADNAAEALSGLIRKNRITVRGADVFIKTNGTLMRLRELPPLSNRDAASYQELNRHVLFPVPEKEYITDSAVVYRSAENIVIAAAALPTDVSALCIKMFKLAGVPLRLLTTKPYLFLRALLLSCVNNSGSKAVIIDNGIKATIIIESCGKPIIIRDTVFSNDSFTADYEDIIDSYSVKHPDEFIFTSNKFNPFYEHFKKLGTVREDDSFFTVSSIIPRFGAVNLLPRAYIAKRMAKKAAILSVVCLFALFAVMFLSNYALKNLTDTVNAQNALTAERILEEKRTETEIAAALVEDMRAAVLPYSDTAITKAYRMLFSNMPPDIQIVKTSANSMQGFFIMDCTSTSVSSLLDYFGFIYENFSKAELTDVSFDNGLYRFSVSFAFNANDTYQ